VIVDFDEVEDFTQVGEDGKIDFGAGFSVSTTGDSETLWDCAANHCPGAACFPAELAPSNSSAVGA